MPVESGIVHRGELLPIHVMSPTKKNTTITEKRMRLIGSIENTIHFNTIADSTKAAGTQSRHHSRSNHMSRLNPMSDPFVRVVGPSAPQAG